MKIHLRKKRSIFWKIPTEELAQRVKEARSLSQVMAHYGLKHKGGNGNTLKRRLLVDSIDYSHLKIGTMSNLGRTFPWRQTSKEELFQRILVKGKTTGGSYLKTYLLRFNLVDNKCYICNQPPEWCGKPLVLQVEHKNGEHDDNRLENLALICPNCHTQTTTFAGRRFRTKFPLSPEVKIKNRAISAFKRRKVPRPSKEELTSQLQTNSILALGRKYHVSGNAVVKWARSYGIDDKLLNPFSRLNRKAVPRAPKVVSKTSKYPNVYHQTTRNVWAALSKAKSNKYFKRFKTEEEAWQFVQSKQVRQAIPNPSDAAT